jgi:hypothetical protein
MSKFDRFCVRGVAVVLFVGTAIMGHWDNGGSALAGFAVIATAGAMFAASFYD